MAAATMPLPAAAPVKKGFFKWAIAVSAALGAMLEIVDTSIVNVALNDMQAALGATLSEIGWVVTAYAIANVIILPLTAWLGYKYGKKRYFVFSLAAFTGASMLCGAATSLPMLVVARIFQGLCGGGLLAKAQTILFENFPPEEQGTAQAIFGVCAIGGPAIGPVLGGYITTNLNWRWIFYVNLPVGIAAVIMSTMFLPPDEEHEKSKGAVDWAGIALLVAAIGSLQTMLEQGQEDNWFESSFITALAVTSFVSGSLFVWRELNIEYPVVDLRVLKHRSLAAGSIFSAVLGMSLYGALFAVPIFAQSILGFTSQQTGLLLMPSALASAFVMPLVGRLSKAVDGRVLIAVGGLILMTAIVMLSQMNPGTGKDEMYWPLIIRGLGTPLMFLPLSLATIGPLPKKDIPAASGIYNLTRQLGGSVGIAVLTMILSRREAFHRAILVEKLGVSDVAVQDRVNLLAAGFQAKGFDPISAKNTAYRALDGIVGVQSAILSFGDMFHIVAIFILVSLPLVFFLGKAKGKAPADVH
jgi:DHA2 family multidrug resistance protein